MTFKVTYILICTVCILFNEAIGYDKFKRDLKQYKTDTSEYFDVNNIKMGMRNSGQLIDPLLQFEWPKNSGLYTIFTGGLWIAGKINNDLRIAAVLYDTTAYLPGNILNGIPQPPENPKFKFYKIFYSDTSGINADYDNWPVEDGAPLSPDNLPLRKSNQNIWCVYNDSRNSSREFSTLPLSIEVQQYVYGDTIPDEIQDAVFVEFNVINKSYSEIRDAYIGIWLDYDIGFFADDLIGIDTTFDLVFAYNYSEYDLNYGEPPPAAGLILLKPPTKNNYSFIVFKSQDSIWEDPLNAQEAYNFLKGLHRNGSQIINPFTAHPTKIMYSGDPISQTGWIDTSSNDKKMLLSFGPTSFQPNELKKLHFALAVAHGTSRINSIIRLKQIVNNIKNYYNQKLIRTINISKNNIDFDTVALNSEKSINITIKNTGEGVVNIDSIISRDSAFSVDNHSFAINPEDSTILAIKFSPQTSGLYQGKIILYHNAYKNSDTIFVQGKGIFYAPAFNIASTEILFDSVFIDSSKTKILKIYNTGNSILKIYSISNTNPDFIVKPESLTINILDSSEISITYTPGFHYPETTNIIFNHNAPTTPDTITITGKKYIIKSLTISAGWNLISIPIKGTKFSITHLFPGATSRGYIYDNEYIAQDSISSNVGFWLKYKNAANLLLTGKPIIAETLIVKPGWNLIGAPSYSIMKDQIIQIPVNNIISKYYRFSGNYMVSDILEPGYGYWVKAANHGLLILKP